MTVFIDNETGFPSEVPCFDCGWPLCCCLCPADDLREEEAAEQAIVTQEIFVNNPNVPPPMVEIGNGYIAHVHCEGARWHVLRWSGLGTHCSEPRCIINMTQRTSNSTILEPYDNLAEAIIGQNMEEKSNCINHEEIICRYTGWQRIDYNEEVQYWHENLGQSLFFGAVNQFGSPVMDCFTAGGEMLRIHPGRSWDEFERNCQSCNITLETAPESPTIPHPPAPHKCQHGE